jgi:glycerol kinase
MKEILTIDQGTTSSRSIIFNESLEIVQESQKEYDLSFPKDGWVEADADDILNSVKETLNNVFMSSKSLSNIISCGITNQRESTVIWDKSTGKAIYPVIIWQDRRTSELCNSLRQDNTITKMVSEKTGLLVDPYFSATKIKWILDNVKGARIKAENGELAFGTIDSFLIWNLTEEKNHLTDVTNASRTLLYNINSLEWDEELLDLFNIPKTLLPEVVASDAEFGNLKFEDSFIPITGVLGDQQSALVGQNCFNKGSMKSTYGTGCFLMVNTKDEIFRSSSGLLSTIGYKINGEIAYAVEGSIFSAGTIIQWLRDEMSFFEESQDSERLIDITGETNNLLFIPAFTGLGAPQWNPDIRASFYGITRDTSKKDFITAAFNSLCYQTNEILGAMKAEGLEVKEMSIDGGMAKNMTFAQLLANITNTNISIPTNTEATALGAAKVAAIGCGLVKSIESFENIGSSQQIISKELSSHKINYMLWKEYLDTMLTLSTKLKNIMNNKD